MRDSKEIKINVWGFLALSSIIFAVSISPAQALPETSILHLCGSTRTAVSKNLKAEESEKLAFWNIDCSVEGIDQPCASSTKLGHRVINVEMLLSRLLDLNYFSGRTIVNSLPSPSELFTSTLPR